MLWPRWLLSLSVGQSVLCIVCGVERQGVSRCKRIEGAPTPGTVVRREEGRVTDSESDRQPAPRHQKVAFSHPSEREFARLLDFYQIPWEYEPRTFPLAWDEEGNVVEAFSPDFYLVEQDLYVELTTMRQKLVTKKNRKLRKLRALYPDINIKLFYRKDFDSLLLSFGMYDREKDLVGETAMGTHRPEHGPLRGNDRDMPD